ncbi:conserved membrane hypothetical protein [Candidatus Zixiibacteriota bacterium]|nr:conserved membrane hypothetical protein [candidate division Zixibacteria bacterium]
MKSTIELAALVGLALGLFLVGYYWSILPDRIPSHYSLAGNVDQWSSKASLLLLPAISLVIYIALNVVIRYPKIYNYPWKFAPQNLHRQQELATLFLSSLKMEIVWLFSLLEYQTIRIALGKEKALGPEFIIIFIVIIFGSAAFYFVKSYRAR